VRVCSCVRACVRVCGVGRGGEALGGGGAGEGSRGAGGVCASAGLPVDFSVESSGHKERNKT
jgi:hypothetical protein